MLCQAQCICNSSFALLVGVVDMAKSKVAAIAEQPKKISGVSAPCDQQDFSDTRVNEGLDRVIDHRPIVNRQQVLIGNTSERIETRTGASGKNNAFHGWIHHRRARSHVELLSCSAAFNNRSSPVHSAGAEKFNPEGRRHGESFAKLQFHSEGTSLLRPGRTRLLLPAWQAP